MPAMPTEYQAEVMLQEAAALWRSVYNFGNSSSPNYREKEQALWAAVEGDFAGAIYNPGVLVGSDLATAIGRAADCIGGLVRAFGQIYGLAGTTLAELWPRIYQRWEAQGKSVNSREMSFGSATNTGITAAAASLHTPSRGEFVADTDYILFTKPNTDTHAFWFDTTGGDTEPAPSQAADASTRIDLSAGGSGAGAVAQAIVDAINTEAIGITAALEETHTHGNVRRVDITVDTPGAAGNSWVLAEFVTTTEFVVATFAGGSNGDTPAGNGSWYRLTVDRYGNDIEACTAEVKTFQCSLDANSGARRHEEVFTGFGAPADVFGTLQTGSGLIGTVTAKSGLGTLAYLNNPSWDADPASATPSQVTGWTPGSSVSNYQIVTGAGNFYRALHGMTDAQSRGLLQTGADVLRQAFKVPLVPGQPYLAAVRYKPSGTANGNVIIRVGGTSKTVAVAGTAWQTLILDRNSGLWFDNFAAGQATLDVEIEWTGTTGTITWDDFTFGPFDLLDGTWWWPLGGDTRWERDDAYQFTDTEAVANAIVQWFLRQAGLYLPGNKAGTETLADPVL